MRSSDIAAIRGAHVAYRNHNEQEADGGQDSLLRRRLHHGFVCRQGVRPRIEPPSCYARACRICHGFGSKTGALQQKRATLRIPENAGEHLKRLRRYCGRARSSDVPPPKHRERAVDMKVESVERLGERDAPNSNEHLLVRELTHRINNELALIIGHASLTAARSTNEEVKSALAGITRLLHHCADVNKALEMPTHSTVINASDYIHVLCQSIRRARLDDRGIELVLVAHPLHMQSTRCWKLGIIVSELITNCVRHAFDGHGGRIQVELSRAGPYVQCCVIDNGSSQSSGVPGQGLKIIKALATELDGEMLYRFGAEGAVSMLIFPLNDEIRQIENDPLENDPWVNDTDCGRLASAIYPS